MRNDKRVRAADARRRRGPTAVDIIDRVLDRGLLIDSHSRVSLGGIDTLTMDGQSVVTSTRADLEYAASLRRPARVVDARPWFDGPADPFVLRPAVTKGARRSAPQRKRKTR